MFMIDVINRGLDRLALFHFRTRRALLIRFHRLLPRPLAILVRNRSCRHRRFVTNTLFHPRLHLLQPLHPLLLQHIVLPLHHFLKRILVHRLLAMLLQLLLELLAALDELPLLRLELLLDLLQLCFELLLMHRQ